MEPVQNSNLVPLDSNIDNYWEKAERATKIALPFLALYAPVGQSISLYTNSVNLVSHPTEIYEASKSLLSIVATVTSFTAGIYLFATIDLATSSKNTATELYHGEYEKAASELAKTVGNALYLSLILSGSNYVLIASLMNQAALQLYAAHNEWKEGKSPEAIANFAMALIRVGQAGQVYSQIPPKVAEEESEKPSLKKTPEQIAQEEKDYEEMKAVLGELDAQYSNPKDKDMALIKALETSVKQGKSGHLRAILEQIDHIHPSLLQTALWHGKTDIAQILIEHATAADGTLKGAWADPKLLFTAIERNQIEVVEMQLDRGMSIEGALIVAAEKSTLKMVDLLLERGADLKDKDWANRSALDHAMLKNKNKIAERLLGLGCEWNEQLQMGQVTLAKDLTKLQQLFEWKIKVSTANGGLPSAVLSGWTEGAEALIEYGADASKPFYLWTAAMTGNVKMASLLLDAGADATKDSSIISQPTFHGNLELVQLLVENGANPNHLSDAAKSGHKDVVKYLLEQGATPTLDAISAALDNGHSDVAIMIQQAGV